jgi:hypothetical protein
VLIELPDACRRRRLTVSNCREEHDRFLAELQALARPVLIGLEPTHDSANSASSRRAWISIKSAFHP